MKLRTQSPASFRTMHAPHGAIVVSDVSHGTGWLLVRWTCPCGHYLEGHATVLAMDDVEVQLQGRCAECDPEADGG